MAESQGDPEGAEEEKKMEMTTFEDIYETIGGFGRFQIFALVVILFPEFPLGMIDLQPVFTTSTRNIQWFCVDDFGTRNDVTNDSKALCSCNGTLDGGTDTIVAEWKLVCDLDFVPDFVTSIQMVGFILGDVLGIYFIDRIGRKKMLYIASFLAMFGSVTSSFAPNIWFYGVARFCSGAGISIILLLSTIYPMEFLTPRWRTICGSAGPFGEGVMLLALFAYIFPNWRDLCLYSALPMLIMFITYPLLPESPRYLLLKGRTKDAEKVLNKIARWNNYPPLESKVVQDLALSFNRQEDEEFEIDQMGQINVKNRKSGKLMYCLKDRQFLKKTLIFISAWFTCLLLYYGIGFNAKNLGGDPYWNVFYMSLADVIGNFSAIFISKWLGRKRAIVVYMGICTFCMINIILMETFSEGMGGPSWFIWPVQNNFITFNIFVFGGKMMAQASWGVLNCFTSESYSTAQRSIGVGAANIAASIASILAPQMAYLGSLHKAAPYYLFGGASFCSTIFILFLKETNGRPIKESS